MGAPFAYISLDLVVVGIQIWRALCQVASGKVKQVIGALVSSQSVQNGGPPGGIEGTFDIKFDVLYRHISVYRALLRRESVLVVVHVVREYVVVNYVY